MKVSKDFVRYILDLAAENLARISYQKRRREIFTLPLNAEAIGWLGLNIATQGRGPGVLEINPVVGVRHQELERLVSELSGIKAHEYIPPSIGTNVGYLMPEKKYKPWLFQERDEYEALVAGMVSTVEKFGRPFMERNAELSILYETMRELGVADNLNYRLPVACVLLGRKVEAEVFLDAKLTEMGGRTDQAANDFVKFATSLRRASTAGTLRIGTTKSR